MTRVGAVLLTPGAGADRDHRTLVAIEEALEVPVARVDFPYRKEGRKAPDRAPRLIGSVVSDSAELARSAGVDPSSLALGGRSMGGRICSMAVAEGLPAVALVLLSYPLHPPGKPDRLRVDHFPAVEVPCLFVGGTRDPFGTPEEVEHHTRAIPGPVTHVWLEGARHSPPESDDPVIAETVADWLADIG